MVPLKYIFRSLGERKSRTIMTVVGVALAVTIYAVMSSVAATMVESFRSTGTPSEVVVAQTGALTLEFSNIERGSHSYIQTLQGVANTGGQPLVSPELWLGCILRSDHHERDVSVRGVTDIARQVYGQVHLAAGSWPGAGHRAAVGRAVAGRLGLDVGESVEFEGERWVIVGLLDGGGRVYDQEIWVDLDELSAAANRLTYSSYTVVVADSAAVAPLVEAVNEGRRFPLTALGATEFYSRTGGMEIFMAFLGTFISLVIAIGAGFAGMNTMYAAVSSRRREIGVLRALGYRSSSVLMSFLFESVLLCLAGGVIGLLLGLILSLVPIDLPLLPSSHVGLGVPQVWQSLVLALGVGLVGGGLPALQAARLRVVDALR